MADDYKTFYENSGDGPRQNALRAGRLWSSRRKPGNVPYRIDRDGDAQMGEGSTRLSLPENLPSQTEVRRGTAHVSRSRSISFTGPGTGMRISTHGPPGAGGDVFSRLGARNFRGEHDSAQRARRGRGAADRPRHHNHHRPQTGPAWFKVKLINTRSVEETWLKKTIQDNLTSPLDVQMSLDGNSRVFHIMGGTVLQQLRDLDRKLNLPNGTRMSISVTPSQGPPAMQVNENIKAKIKMVMQSRYDGSTESLNLSSFAEDPDFKKEGWSIAPFRSNIMTAIVQLIQANTPNLRALDLSKNKIRELTVLATLGGKIPLERLNLIENQIFKAHELDRLKAFPLLRDLDVSGNPLREEYRDTPTYVENIRKRLGSLVRLDGLELPKKIGFNAPVRVSLPAPKPFHTPSEEGKAQLMTFVHQFFLCYDAQRHTLVNAYADDAQFSLEFLRCPDRPPAYNQNNRNLQFVVDSSQRIRKLQIGKTAIVNLFVSLPLTQHLLESFTMDVFYSEHPLVGFNTSGCFREDYSEVTKKGTLRSFSRNFVVKIIAQGLSILSDTLTITVANPEQAKQFSDLPLAKTPPVPLPSTSHQLMPTGPAINPIPDEATQSAMVAQFALQSGMNEPYSRMCLDHNKWDYDKAAAVFTQMKAENQLPAEAFIK